MIKVLNKVPDMCAVAVLIMALPMARPLAAQEVIPPGSFLPLESNTSRASAGIFGTDVDDYMSYFYWPDVEFEKGFGFIGGGAYQVSGDTRGALNAGYAIGGMDESFYLGLWYQGNIVRVTGSDVEKTLETEWDNTLRQDISKTETTRYPAGWIESANRIEALLAFNSILGFRVGFLESLASNKHDGPVGNLVVDTDTVVTTNMDGTKHYDREITEYSEFQGHIMPYLGVGTTISLGENMGLRPYFEAAVDFYSDRRIYQHRTYDVVNGQKINMVRTLGDGHNSGYVEPAFSVGADLDIGDISIGLDYGIGFKAYNNKYDATGLSGRAKGTVEWEVTHPDARARVNEKSEYYNRTLTNTDLTLDIDEKKEMSHNITPSFYIAKDITEDFKLGFYAGIPFSLETSSSKPYTEIHSIEKLDYKDAADRDGNYTETTVTRTYEHPTEKFSLGIGLELAIGASFRLIPDRFTLNAGITATPCAFTRIEKKTMPLSIASEIQTTRKEGKKRERTTMNEKTVESAGTSRTDELTVETEWVGYSGGFTGGFMFNFNEQATLDMVIAASGSNNFQDFSLANVNVLISFKF